MDYGGGAPTAALDNVASSIAGRSPIPRAADTRAVDVLYLTKKETEVKITCGGDEAKHFGGSEGWEEAAEAGSGGGNQRWKGVAGASLINFVIRM